MTLLRIDSRAFALSRIQIRQMNASNPWILLPLCSRSFVRLQIKLN